MKIITIRSSSVKTRASRLMFFYEFTNELTFPSKVLDAASVDIVRISYSQSNCFWAFLRFSVNDVINFIDLCVVSGVKFPIRRGFFRPFMAFVLYREMLVFFEQNRSVIEKVYISNLTNPLCIAVQYAATASAIETIFIEHATTPPCFLDVPIPQFRSLILSSMLSEYHFKQHLKYKEIPVSVVTDRRLIAQGDFQAHRQVSTVGILLNSDDSILYLMQALFRLNVMGLSVRVRPHPSDGRLLIKAIAVVWNKGVDSSESLDEFLGSVERVLGGNTSALISAIDSGCDCAYFNFDKKRRNDDFYGISDFFPIPKLRSFSEIMGWASDA